MWVERLGFLDTRLLGAIIEIVRIEFSRDLIDFLLLLVGVGYYRIEVWLIDVQYI